MSYKLTTFERALLAQFEPLATASEQALKGLEIVSKRLELLSSATEKRFKEMAERSRGWRKPWTSKRGSPRLGGRSPRAWCSR